MLRSIQVWMCCPRHEPSYILTSSLPYSCHLLLKHKCLPFDPLVLGIERTDEKCSCLLLCILGGDEVGICSRMVTGVSRVKAIRKHYRSRTMEIWKCPLAPDRLIRPQNIFSFFADWCSNPGGATSMSDGLDECTWKFDPTIDGFGDMSM